MKKITFLFFLSVAIFFCSCKKDCINFVIENNVGFKDYKVDFYSAHKDFKIEEAVFETVTEQVLVREAHLSGAVFETLTEQVLVKDSYTQHQIETSQKINLVSNTETNTISEINCFHFFEPSEFVENVFPAEYMTRAIQLVVVPGTGTEIPAVYSTIVKRLLVTDSKIVEADEPQPFEQITFRIPDNTTMLDYLEDQLAQQSISDCVEGVSFEIQE